MAQIYSESESFGETELDTDNNFILKNITNDWDMLNLKINKSLGITDEIITIYKSKEEDAKFNNLLPNNNSSSFENINNEFKRNELINDEAIQMGDDNLPPPII